MKIKVFYGLSGTLKSTTIKRKYCWPFSLVNPELEGENRPIAVVIKSAIKKWKNNRDQLFPWLKEETNLNYALLHLVRLEEYLGNNDFENYLYIIERGVSDMMFYEYQKSPNLITASIINGAINREKEILGENAEKVLMIMKDEDFIINKVLSENTRATCFRGVEDYLKKQEDYIKFTKQYNQVNEEIIIRDAKKYLSDLGIDYIV